jgi:hypothetical protein
MREEEEEGGGHVADGGVGGRDAGKGGRGGGGEGQAQRLTFEDDLDGAGMRKCQKKPNKYLKETLYIAKRDLLTLEAAEQVCVSVKRDLIHI